MFSVAQSTTPLTFACTVFIRMINKCTVYIIIKFYRYHYHLLGRITTRMRFNSELDRLVDRAADSHGEC